MCDVFFGLRIEVMTLNVKDAFLGRLRIEGRLVNYVQSWFCPLSIYGDPESQAFLRANMLSKEINIMAIVWKIEKLIWHSKISANLSFNQK